MRKLGYMFWLPFLKCRKLIAQGLAVIAEYLVLSTALTVGSEAFKLGKESLQKTFYELKAKLFSRHNSETNAKLA